MPTIKIDEESAQCKRLYTFPDPNLETLEENLFFLLRNSTELGFKPRYNFKPEYLSFDVYGTPALAPLLMFVNNIGSVEEFADLPKVVIPSLDSITTILADIFPEEDISDLESITW
jgi:hypothetical protein